MIKVTEIYHILVLWNYKKYTTYRYWENIKIYNISAFQNYKLNTGYEFNIV